jgi:gas vesicle protein
MSKNQVVSFLIGLLSGAIVGTATIILLAPQSGMQTREGIAQRVNEIIDAGRRAVVERRQELTQEYQTRIEIPLPPVEPDAA